MPEIPQIVLPHGGYKNLIVYRKSETIYQATVLFCRRFLPKFGDRTVDQMTQAARSCKQNIAEGSASSGTSKETEIKLTNVARATLDELLEDYLDYLKSHGGVEWSVRDEKKKAARDFAKEHADWAVWQKFFRTRDDVTCCNLMIVIIQQTKYLLDQMIRRQEADFKKFGGVRERMHAARTAVRGEDWDKGIYSRLDGANSLDELKSRLAETIRRTRESAAAIARRKGWSVPCLSFLLSFSSLVPAFDRIANFFPRFGRENLMRAIAWSKSDIDYSVGGVSKEIAEKRFANLIRPRENVVQYGATQVQLTQDPQGEVDRIFNALVA